MKKLLMILIIICLSTIFLKYFISDYNIEYKYNNYKIKTTYKDNRYYFEIKDDITYNFDIYAKRSIKKKVIKKIIKIEDENFECIYPIINGLETYPLCYMNNEYIDYNLIESEKLQKYKNQSKELENNKNFTYYNNLDENTYIALWNYNGYIIMNSDKYNNVDLFKKDKYDNSLSYMINEYIYLPNYDQEHEYNEIIKLNILTQEKEVIKLDYVIDYDSYIVGNINNKLYIFDNKYAVLYEINTKRKNAKIIGDNEKGYYKYKNGEFVSCSKSEYKVDKIKYETEERKISNYKYTLDNGVYKSINENKKIVTKIINNNVDLIKENKDYLYFIENSNLKLYNPKNGIKNIFNYYELEFNKNNNIFIYIK